MATAIEEVLGLLQAAGGEASLRGSLGRWRVKVSEAIDDVIRAVDQVSAQQKQITASPALQQVKRGSNATVPNGSTASLFGDSPLSINATELHQQVFVFFRSDRQSSLPAGSAQYQLRLDGVNVGAPSTAAGNVRSNVVINEIVDLGLIGHHTIDVVVTASGGDELVIAAMVLGSITRS